MNRFLMTAILAIACCPVSAQTAGDPEDPFERYIADNADLYILIHNNDDYGGTGISYEGSASVTVYADIADADLSGLVDGGLGYADELDGVDQEIDFYDANASYFSNDFTMGAWFDPDTDSDQALFGFGTNFQLDLKAPDSFGISDLLVRCNGSGGSDSDYVALGATVFDETSRFFCGIQWDASEEELYVHVESDEGTQVYTDTLDWSNSGGPTTTETVKWGTTNFPSFPFGTISYFDGKIDSFFIIEGITIDLYEACDYGWLGYQFERGDANADDSVNLADIVAIGAYLGGTLTPDCLDALDANGDNAINVADQVFLSSYVFSSGTAPPTPGPTTCGFDAAVDTLTCNEGTTGCN